MCSAYPKNSFPVSVGSNPFSDTFKQADAVIIFQLFDGKADRGLGEMKFHRLPESHCCGGYRYENFHVPKSHMSAPPYIRKILYI